VYIPVPVYPIRWRPTSQWGVDPGGEVISMQYSVVSASGEAAASAVFWAVFVKDFDPLGDCFSAPARFFEA